MPCPKKILVGTLGYAVITFPLAYIWHLVAFKDTYEQLNYISRDEPIIVFGFASIVIQGALLATIYPLACGRMSFRKGAVTFILLIGTYHWTMHVLAAAAKNNIAPLLTWFCIESLYLAIQFTLGGFLMAFINRPANRTATNDL